METFIGTYVDGEIEGKGKTFNAGVPVYDGNFTNGKYDGEGILFDEEGMIRYEGEFKEGEYEGKGKLHEKDQIIYEGTFEKGLYSGNGVEYRNKKKVYEGTFVNGEYSGNGKQYSNKKKIYEGKFENGLYEGKGIQYVDGKKVYEGDFSAGKRSGYGVEYKNGKVLYKGDFADDLYNGTGVAYNSDGEIAFKGEFVDGYYSGDGSLNLEKGEIVKGDFDHGTVVGDAKCYRDGKLWYEGSLKDYIPDGKGKIYDDSVVIYDGPVVAGTINGAQLTGLTMDEVLAIFQKKGIRKIEDDGFTYSYPRLGASLLFSFATADDEPRVKKFYLTETNASEKLGLLVWKTDKDFDQYRKKGYDDFTDLKEREGIDQKGYYHSYVGEEFALALYSDKKDSKIKTYEWEGFGNQNASESDEVTEETSVTDEAAAAQEKMNDLLDKIGLGAPGDETVKGGGADAGAGAAAAAGAAASGGAANAGGGAADAGAGAAAGGAANAGAGAATMVATAGNTAATTTAAEKKSPYYGTAAPTEVIKKASKKDRNKVVKDMITYYAAAERVTSAKEKNKMIEKSIDKANDDAAMGEDNEERLKDLKKQAKANELEITAATAEMAQSAQDISILTGGDTGAGADMSQAAVFIDVSSIDTDKLSEAAVKNALAKNEEDYAAAMESYKETVKKNAKKLERAFNKSELSNRLDSGFDAAESDDPNGESEYVVRYNKLKEEVEDCLERLFEVEKPKQGEINDQEIYKLLQTQMVQLQLAGENIKASKDAYEEAISYQQSMEKKFKIGSAGEDELNSAKMAVMDSCSALYDNLANFSIIASEMNDVSGGYISESTGWLADSFAGE